MKPSERIDQLRDPSAMGVGPYIDADVAYLDEQHESERRGGGGEPTVGVFAREALQAWADTFALGPHDEHECRQCRRIMSRDVGDEATVLCHSCAQTFIEWFVPGLLASALRTAGRGKLLPTDPEDERIVDDLVARRTAGLKVTAISKSETPPQGDREDEAGVIAMFVEWEKPDHPDSDADTWDARTPAFKDKMRRAFRVARAWQAEEGDGFGHSSCAAADALIEELKAKLDAAEESAADAELLSDRAFAAREIEIAIERAEKAESALKLAEHGHHGTRHELDRVRGELETTKGALAEAERKVQAWEPGVRLAIATCGKDWEESDYDAICDWNYKLPEELRPSSGAGGDGG